MQERPVPLIPRPPLEPAEQAALQASMSRHPAGKARELSRCPTCGQNASGALGEPQNALI